MIINKLIYLSGFITRYINFKYFYNFNGIITLFVSKKKIVKIKLNSDTYFSFFLKDPYYNRLIYPKFKYEPEIEFLLKKLRNIDFLFVDAGANYGYWSLLVSSKKFNKKKAIALEPLKSNYNFLCINRLNNKNRFKALNLGVGEKKKYTKIYYKDQNSNVGASIYKDNNKKLISEKIKIDKIDNILLNRKEKNLIIKLDVEGSEIKALTGSKNILKKNCLIIYEDHGQDKYHSNTKYLLKKNYSIYFCNKSKILNIQNFIELNKIKKQKNVGYNFVATKSDIFKKKLNY
jgi:FkbM family methyltransferase